MYKTFLILFIWLTALIGHLAIKRIEPDNHWYKIYAFFVATAFTAFLVLSGQ